MMVFTWVSVDVMDFFLLSVGVSERFRMRVLSLTRDRRDVSSRGVDEPGVSTHLKHRSYILIKNALLFIPNNRIFMLCKSRLK
jgi:hypothetical protein